MGCSGEKKVVLFSPTRKKQKYWEAKLVFLCSPDKEYTSGRVILPEWMEEKLGEVLLGEFCIEETGSRRFRKRTYRLERVISVEEAKSVLEGVSSYCLKRIVSSSNLPGWLRKTAGDILSREEEREEERRRRKVERYYRMLRKSAEWLREKDNPRSILRLLRRMEEKSKVVFGEKWEEELKRILAESGLGSILRRALRKGADRETLKELSSLPYLPEEARGVLIEAEKALTAVDYLSLRECRKTPPAKMTEAEPLELGGAFGVALTSLRSLIVEGLKKVGDVCLMFWGGDALQSIKTVFGVDSPEYREYKELLREEIGRRVEKYGAGGFVGRILHSLLEGSVFFDVMRIDPQKSETWVMLEEEIKRRITREKLGEILGVLGRLQEAEAVSPILKAYAVRRLGVERAKELEGVLGGLPDTAGFGARATLHSVGRPEVRRFVLAVGLLLKLLSWESLAILGFSPPGVISLLGGEDKRVFEGLRKAGLRVRWGIVPLDSLGGVLLEAVESIHKKSLRELSLVREGEVIVEQRAGGSEYLLIKRRVNSYSQYFLVGREKGRLPFIHRLPWREEGYWEGRSIVDVLNSVFLHNAGFERLQGDVIGKKLDEEATRRVLGVLYKKKKKAKIYIRVGEWKLDTQYTEIILHGVDLRGFLYTVDVEGEKPRFRVPVLPGAEPKTRTVFLFAGSSKMLGVGGLGEKKAVVFSWSRRLLEEALGKLGYRGEIEGRNVGSGRKLWLSKIEINVEYEVYEVWGDCPKESLREVEELFGEGKEEWGLEVLCRGTPKRAEVEPSISIGAIRNHIVAGKKVFSFPVRVSWGGRTSLVIPAYIVLDPILLHPQHKPVRRRGWWLIVSSMRHIRQIEREVRGFLGGD